MMDIPIIIWSYYISIIMMAKLGFLIGYYLFLDEII